MKNELKFLDEFRSILKSYELSDQAKELLKSVKLVLLASPTAVGRNTIINELIKSGEYHNIISDTTRHPRVNDGVMEQDGVTYWFKSEEEFLNGLRNGEYLEAGVIHSQQVSGISLRELKIARDEHKNAITDVEVQGVRAILNAKPDTIAIFLLPPSFEEWMRRLNNRGQMSNIEKKRRLESAVDEFEFALKSNYLKFMISDTIEQSIEHIRRIVDNPTDQDDQSEDRKLTEQLLEQAKMALQKI